MFPHALLRDSFQQNIGHCGKEIVECGVHGHYRTMRFERPAALQSSWNRLALHLRYYNVKFLAGNLNMALTQVVRQLRSGGLMVTAAAASEAKGAALTAVGTSSATGAALTMGMAASAMAKSLRVARRPWFSGPGPAVMNCLKICGRGWQR